MTNAASPSPGGNAAASQDAAYDRAWMGHPAGLSTLFFTEMWERFSYYGMRALLILWVTAAVIDGGVGMTTARAAAIYGWYTFGVYAAAIPGGWIADRLLGQYRSVLLGGILIALGHYSLAVGELNFFYGGLGLIVAGTGLLKPNISTMVGSLYPKDDARRDGGFSIFYMGINVGAFVAPLVCGTLGQRVGWHWGFGAAGVGMTLGLLQYVLGRRRLASAMKRIDQAKTLKAAAGRVAERRRFTPTERKRIAVIGILFIFTTLFWAAFEQAGSSLNLFAARLTRTSVFGLDFPSTWFQSLNSLFIIMLAPVFAWLWVWLDRRNREPSSPTKFSFGLIFVGLGFLLLVPAALISGGGQGLVSPLWLTGVYLLHTIGELALSPVGLSVVTKLAPARIVGSMMGVWFLSIAFGNKLGGWVAGFFDTLPLPQLFGAVFATTAAAGLVLLLFVKPIRKLMGGVH
jgi:POT family proton-dependent oligopeptide transporter